MKDAQTQWHPIHACNDGVFNTVSGKKIDLLQPTPDMIDINDIAHALSRICRFGGHAKEFYSVAQHSLLVAAMAPDELKLEALLHDAAEAYVGDVIKPLKVLLGDVYDQIERGFMNAITAKFGLNKAILQGLKEYDRKALEVEQELLQLGYEDRYIDLCLTVSAPFWEPESHPVAVKVAFLEEFKRLFEVRVTALPAGQQLNS